MTLCCSFSLWSHSKTCRIPLPPPPPLALPLYFPRTFCNLHVERWAFDVELLYIAQRLKIPIAEVAVNWQEMEGSKLVPFWSWLEMGRDLMLISLRHMTGAWKIAPEPKIA